MVRPESVFGEDWGRGLCVCLLKHRAEVVERLSEDGRGDSFLEEIARWSERYGLNSPSARLTSQERGDALEDLWGLCNNYGIVEILVAEGWAEEVAREARPREPAPCLGEQRRPEMFLLKAAPASDKEILGLLARVAGVYRRGE